MEQQTAFEPALSVLDMQDTDPQQAFRDRVAKIKDRKTGAADRFAPEMLDEKPETEKRESGTPTLLRIIAISLAVTSLMITEFPDKFGVASFFGDPADAAETTSDSSADEPRAPALKL